MPDGTPPPPPPNNGAPRFAWLDPVERVSWLDREPPGGCVVHDLDGLSGECVVCGRDPLAEAYQARLREHLRESKP